MSWEEFPRNNIPKGVGLITFKGSEIETNETNPFKWNLGGYKDTTVLMYPMVQAAQAGCEQILFGNSRGAASIILALHCLEYPDQHLPFWKKLGLAPNNIPNRKAVEAIRKSITKIFLANPLLDVNKAIGIVTQRTREQLVQKEEEDDIKEKVEDCLYGTAWLWSKYYKFKNLGTDISDSAGTTIGSSTMNLFGSRDRNLAQPIELLKKLKKKNYSNYTIDFSLVYEDWDDVVSTFYNKTVLKLAKKVSSWEAREENYQHREIDQSRLHRYLKKNY